jgi:hypothetical protein
MPVSELSLHLNTQALAKISIYVLCEILRTSKSIETKMLAQV